MKSCALQVHTLALPRSICEQAHTLKRKRNPLSLIQQVRPTPCVRSAVPPDLRTHPQVVSIQYNCKLELFQANKAWRSSWNLSHAVHHSSNLSTQQLLLVRESLTRKEGNNDLLSSLLKGKTVNRCCLPSLSDSPWPAGAAVWTDCWSGALHDWDFRSSSKPYSPEKAQVCSYIGWRLPVGEFWGLEALQT